MWRTLSILGLLTLAACNAPTGPSAGFTTEGGKGAGQSDCGLKPNTSGCERPL